MLLFTRSSQNIFVKNKYCVSFFFLFLFFFFIKFQNKNKKDYGRQWASNHTFPLYPLPFHLPSPPLQAQNTKILKKPKKKKKKHKKKKNKEKGKRTMVQEQECGLWKKFQFCRENKGFNKANFFSILLLLLSIFFFSLTSFFNQSKQFIAINCAFKLIVDL